MFPLGSQPSNLPDWGKAAASGLVLLVSNLMEEVLQYISISTNLMEEAIKKEEQSQNLSSDREPRGEGPRIDQDRVASIIPGGLQNQDLNIIAQCQEEKQDTVLKGGKILGAKVQQGPISQGKACLITQTQTGRNWSEEVQNHRTLNTFLTLMQQDYGLPVIESYLRLLHGGVHYAAQKLRQPSPVFLSNSSKTIYQGGKTNKKYLMLDLDQTLIKTKVNEHHKPNVSSFKVMIRPYTFTFLKELSEYFQIFVFTASTRGYAEAAIKKINKHEHYIKDKLTRDNCFTTRKGKYIKDLRIIKDRELKDIVIVDNLVESFGFQIDNGIPILEFNGQEGDQELLKLIPFLKQLSSLEDVRPAIRQKYHLQGLLELKKKDLDLFFQSRSA